MKFDDLELLMKTTENNNKKIKDKRNYTTFIRNNIAIFKWYGKN